MAAGVRLLRVPLRPELLLFRPLLALAVRLLPVRLLVVPFRPLRPLPFRSLRLLLLAERSLRLFPLRLLVPWRLRPEPLLADCSSRLLAPCRLRPERLLAPASFRLELFRSLRLLLPRPFRVPEERSFAAVRVRVGAGLSSLLAAACSWSIRCPASLVQLCEETPRELSWRAKLLAVASFGKGPTSSRFDAM